MTELRYKTILTAVHQTVYQLLVGFTTKEHPYSLIGFLDTADPNLKAGCDRSEIFAPASSSRLSIFNCGVSRN